MPFSPTWMGKDEGGLSRKQARKQKNKGGDFTCLRCNQRFASERTLVSHVAGKHSFPCPHCKRTYRLAGRLKNHINDAHHKSPSSQKLPKKQAASAILH